MKIYNDLLYELEVRGFYVKIILLIDFLFIFIKVQIDFESSFFFTIISILLEVIVDNFVIWIENLSFCRERTSVDDNNIVFKNEELQQIKQKVNLRVVTENHF